MEMGIRAQDVQIETCHYWQLWLALFLVQKIEIGSWEI